MITAAIFVSFYLLCVQLDRLFLFYPIFCILYLFRSPSNLSVFLQSVVPKSVVPNPQSVVRKRKSVILIFNGSEHKVKNKAIDIFANKTQLNSKSEEKSVQRDAILICLQYIYSCATVGMIFFRKPVIEMWIILIGIIKPISTQGRML